MSIFDKVSLRRPKSSKFDLSHFRKMSLNMGKLIPILCQEILPGDKFRVNSEVFLRFAPLLAPVMHNVDVYTHYFFVPHRLDWSEWEEFITGGVTGGSVPQPPTIVVSTAGCATGAFKNGTVWDYMGLPTFAESTVVTDPTYVSALPFRAYQRIFNEYYRDQTLTQPADITEDGGVIDPSNAEFLAMLTMRDRAWEKDYFTSAMPTAQRGPEVLMPVEGEGSVTYDPVSKILKSDGSFADVDKLMGTSDAFGNLDVGKNSNITTGTTGRIENIDTVNFQNSSVTINDLRKATKLQVWLEKMMLGGARYVEQLLVMFGVKSSDARLQRPEYLGGGRQPVVISEVLSSFQDAAGAGAPQGNMAGHGVSVGRSNGFSRRFEEHGYVIGIMSVIPRTAYQQGIPKQFQRFEKLDYAWPDFAHLGEQEIATRELYYDPAQPSGTQSNTFGYQSRYAEYKFCSSTVHGDFRGNLSYWHMGRIFDGVPLLNSSFVTSNPTDRIFAVEDPDVQKLYCQIHNSVSAVRPLPYFGTPQL